MAGPIIISILTNARQANRDLNATASTAQKIGDGFRRAAAPAAAGLAGIAAAAKQTIDAASDVAEALSKNDVIFGNQAADIEAFADRAASALGQSKVQALDATSTFGSIAQSAGLTGDKAAEFAKQFTSLSSDLASFGNTDVQTAIDAIGSAMRGEAEPIRKYNVLLDDARLRAEAMRLGLVKTTKEALTPQQKALAAAQVILSQTTQAQGDFAKTSDGAANKTRILAAQQADLKAKLGEQLLPIYEKFLGILQKVLGWIEKHQTETKIIVGLVAGLAGVILAVNGAMSAYRAVTAIATGVTRAFSFALATSPIGLFVLAIAGLVTALVILYNKSEKVRNIIDSVGRFIKKIPEYVSAAADAMGSILSGLYDSVTGALSDAGTWLLDAGKQVIQGLIDGITSRIGDVVSTMGGIVNSIVGFVESPLGFDINSPSKVFKRIGGEVMEGLAAGILGGSARAQKVIARITSKLSKSAARELKSQFDQYRDLARQQDRLTASLGRAQDKLKGLRDTARDYATSLKESIVDFGSITGLGDDGGFGSFSQLVDKLRGRAADADRFAKVIEQLRKQGLNQTTLDQLLAAGPDSIGTAQTILGGGAAGIAQINRLTKRLERTGQAMGNAAADSLYGAGLRAAQGVVDGFKRDQRELDRLATRFARILRQGVLEGLEATAAQKAAREARERERKARQELREARAEAGADGKITDRERQHIRELLKELERSRGTTRIQFSSEQVDQMTRGRRINADLNAWLSAGGRQGSR
ncbi:hypothetical protein GCM10023340_36390 [Nocardioides marinquilinus]|uniref:Phage tail tape measure protein n=1 Tax=Nocardioides marinquilinus TaxID=1210400 RepID=A0ABP9PYL9_9ACTN